jgi:hypothetical protein
MHVGGWQREVEPMSRKVKEYIEKGEGGVPSDLHQRRRLLQLTLKRNRLLPEGEGHASAREPGKEGGK